MYTCTYMRVLEVYIVHTRSMIVSAERFQFVRHGVQKRTLTVRLHSKGSAQTHAVLAA